MGRIGEGDGMQLTQMCACVPDIRAPSLNYNWIVIILRVCGKQWRGCRPAIGKTCNANLRITSHTLAQKSVRACARITCAVDTSARQSRVQSVVRANNMHLVSC